MTTTAKNSAGNAVRTESAVGSRLVDWAEPEADCALCPRLLAFRHDNRQRYPDFFNAPVPPFGPANARLLIVGLAPGLKGANRTGRPFTGDYAGDLLYRTLIDYGFATGLYGAAADDGLDLDDCRIVNAVRCVPPENKPIGSEVTTCRRFLAGEISSMPELAVIVALGQIAHRAVVAAFGVRQSAFAFGHGQVHRLPAVSSGGTSVALADSYHCSRYNTNTGRLTEPMFCSVFDTVRALLDGPNRAGPAKRKTSMGA